MEPEEYLKLAFERIEEEDNEQIIKKMVKRIRQVEELNTKIKQLDHEIKLLSEGKNIVEDGDLLLPEQFNELME